MNKLIIVFVSILLMSEMGAQQTVTISGKKYWTAKNLDVSTYSDGTPIPEIKDRTKWNRLTTGAWCYYDDDPANGKIYGKLYNWYAVAGIYDEASLVNPSIRKKLAPKGFHIPDRDEWTALITRLGGQNLAGGKMKEQGTAHWETPNTGASNSSGMTALPGGALGILKIFRNLGILCNWWGEANNDSTIMVVLNNNSSNVFLKFPYERILGLSVRCVTDSVSQDWMVKNLAVSTYSDGTAIPYVSDPVAWSGLKTGAWCYYNNDPAHDAVYGKLYNWYAVAGIYDEASLTDPGKRKKLAPKGFEIPDNHDWEILRKNLGDKAGGKIKEKGFLHWKTPNTGADNSSGFTGLPGGMRMPEGKFGNQSGFGYWWSISETASKRAGNSRILSYQSDDILSNTDNKQYGYSVRCIKRKFAIGQPYRGGIIAYFLQPGDPGYNAHVPHGLIVAEDNLATGENQNRTLGIQWKSEEPYGGEGRDEKNTETTVRATGIGKGYENTKAIIAVLDKKGVMKYAAKLCDDLVLDGYSDWYLPSKEELYRIYKNKTAIGGFLDSEYWSSSEEDKYTAWSQDFKTGNQRPLSKGIVRIVRPVRSF